MYWLVNCLSLWNWTCGCICTYIHATSQSVQNIKNNWHEQNPVHPLEHNTYMKRIEKSLMHPYGHPPSTYNCQLVWTACHTFGVPQPVVGLPRMWKDCCRHCWRLQRWYEHTVWPICQSTSMHLPSTSSTHAKAYTCSKGALSNTAHATAIHVGKCSALLGQQSHDLAHTISCIDLRSGAEDRGCAMQWCKAGAAL